MPPKTNNTGNRSLPKFGEWDVTNPQSAEGFTVIFNTARNQKKNDNNNAGTTGPNKAPNQYNQVHDKPNQNQKQRHDKKKKWLCCVFG
ncbi:Protein NOI4 [Bienertia sinuspersici]